MLGKSLTHSGCEHVPDDVHAGCARSDSREAFRFTWGCQNSKNQLILFRLGKPDNLVTANQLLSAGRCPTRADKDAHNNVVRSVMFISLVLLVKVQP